MGRKLLLLIALLATLVVLGCWDNRRQMQRVLDEGYATTAQVTGAQYQRKLPIAADGWRPRFVEQEISVDLSWQGKDGKPHAHTKVPVSEALARTIVAGDQVRLVVLPAKVLDDGTVPVITGDAGGRLASLQSWLAAAGYTALAAWAAFAALTLIQRRRTGTTAGPAIVPPPRRMFVGLAMLGVGALLAFSAWSEGRSGDAVALGGQEATADIVHAGPVPGKEGSYAVQLAWKDAQGTVHRFGPVPVSDAFWGKITRNGELVVRQTAIRYRQDDPQMRPLIVEDAPEQHWQTRFGMGAGLLLLILGAAVLFSGLRTLRNASPKR